MLGKRRMASRLSKEIKRPFKDMMDYGVYRKVTGTQIETLSVGGYTMRCDGEKLTLTIPDYTAPGKYITRTLDI